MYILQQYMLKISCPYSSPAGTPVKQERGIQ